MYFTPYALPSIASTVIVFSLLIYVSLFRRHSSGAWQFIAIMVCFTAWSFGYAMVLMNNQIEWKIFWFNLAQIGPDFAPLFWLFLALEHSGRRDILHNRKILALFILPLTTQFLMWTNNYHHLLRRHIQLSAFGNQTTYLAIERGPWYPVETLYGYTLVAFTLYLLIRFLPWSSSKKQTAVLLGSMILPILSNLLDVFKLNPLKPFGPTSIVFSFAGLILAWGLFRQRLLDITPIARNVVLEKIGDGVIVLDTRYRIVDINPVACRLLNRENDAPSELIGKNLHESLTLWPEWKQPLVFTHDSRVQLALNIAGERRFYQVAISSLTDHRQKVVGWITIFSDITDEKQTNERLQFQLDEIKHLQGQLREQAIRDPLTGCFNRHYLNEMLLRESSRANREKNTIGLLMLDIDHFKRINDTHGHVNGDRVLQLVGEKLQRWVRVEDTVCRYGGEEFLIVFPGISMQAACERANHLHRQIDELQVPITTDISVNVTVSMGVALYPLHGQTIEQVLEYADEALYAAKKAGRNGVCIWGSAPFIHSPQ